MAEREIGCLLSGGLDSSLITSLVSKYNQDKQLNTFSIGMPGSIDLEYAQTVANFLNTKHHQIEISEKEFLSAIETVIYNIESYDTTTVRASVGNYLVSKYISKNTDCKVIFNGDGSDEVGRLQGSANLRLPEMGVGFSGQCYADPDHRVSDVFPGDGPDHRGRRVDILGFHRNVHGDETAGG